MNSFQIGFIKRAQEYGLDYQQAVELVKTADSRKEQAKDLIPMNAVGAIGDYLQPGGFGGYRAGKATALAKGLGKEPGITTTNPQLSSLLGAGAGALGGGAIGSLFNKPYDAASGMPGHGDMDPTGSILGALTGALAGYLAPSAVRRGDMKQNLSEYSHGAKIKPEKPDKMRGIGNILLPGSGNHRKGEAVGYNKLRGVEEDETMNTASNALQTVMPTTRLPLGIAQNYSADQIMDKKK